MAIIGKYTRNSDPEQLEDAWKSLTYKTEIPPYVSPARLKEQIQMLAEDQPEIKKLEAEKMIENGVLKKLADSGWIKELFARGGTLGDAPPWARSIGLCLEEDPRAYE